MKFDTGALGYALLLETVLAVLAFFGGPHGFLGMLPWLLQLPGALLFFFGPPGANKIVLLGFSFLIQMMIWFAIIATWRAVRRHRKTHGRS